MPKSTLHTDFKHRKQKVGKRKLIPANVTSTVFSWKTLTTGSKNPSTETTKDGCSSLDEVLAACRNHNATSRREGLVHLVSFVGRDVRQTQLHLSRLVLAIADRIVDPEAPVRAATVAALQSVLAACAPEAMLSFIPLLAAYLASALSKLLPSLRLDALAHVLMLAQSVPAARPLLLRSLSHCIVSLLDPHLHTLTCMSYSSRGLPVALALGGAAAASASSSHPSDGRLSSKDVAGAPPSSSAPAAVRRVKLTSTEARIVVASVLHELLSPCPASTGCVDASPTFSASWIPERRIRLAPGPAAWPQGAVGAALADLEAAGASEPSLQTWRRGFAEPPRAVASAGVKASSTLESSNLTLSDSLSAAHHLLQLWLDCGPSDEGAGFAAAESPEIFARQATVTDSLAAVVTRVVATHRTGQGSPLALRVHAPLTRISCTPGSVPTHGGASQNALKVLEQSVLAARRHEEAGGESDAAPSPTLRSPPSIPDHCLWGGLQALQCAIRQHVLPRFPSAAARGGVRMQAAALGLSLSVAALLLALLPGPELLHAAAAAAALQEEATAQTAPPGSSHSVSHPRAIPTRVESLAPSGARKRRRAAERALRGDDDAQRVESVIAAPVVAPVESSSEEEEADPTPLPAKAAPVSSSQRRWVAAGLPGALAVVGRIRGFVIAALKDAATACSASIAPRLLTLAHELMAYLDAPAAAEITYLLTDLYESLPLASSERLCFAVSFANRLRSEILRRAASHDPTLSSSCGDARLPNDAVSTWLASFPRILWAAGGADVAAAGALVSALHSLARIAVQPSSPLALALRGVARQLVPVLYTVASSGGGSGVYGPFVDSFPPALQERLLSVLFIAGALTPPLRRALGVVARCPRVVPAVRSFALEIFVALSLGSQGSPSQADGESEMGTLAELQGWSRALEGLAAVLTTCLGRHVEVNHVGELLVSPFSEREAGVLSVLVPAVAEPSSLTSGWGWKLDSLCDGADAAYSYVLNRLPSVASAIACVLPGSSDASHRVWNAFESVAAQLLLGDRSLTERLPSPRETELIVAWYRFAMVLTNSHERQVAPSCRSGDSVFVSCLCAAVTALLLRGGLDGHVEESTESLLCDGGGAIAASWLSHAVAILQGQHAHPTVAASQTLQAVVRLVSAQRIVLQWRSFSGNRQSALVSVLSDACNAARSLSVSLGGTVAWSSADQATAALVVSLISTSGLSTGT